MRFLIFICDANLDHWAEAPHSCNNLVAPDRVGTQLAFPLYAFRRFNCFFYILLEWIVEIIDHVVPLHLSFGDFIKFFLNASRKTVIHDVIKILLQEIGYYKTKVCRK